MDDKRRNKEKIIDFFASFLLNLSIKKTRIIVRKTEGRLMKKTGITDKNASIFILFRYNNENKRLKKTIKVQFVYAPKAYMKGGESIKSMHEKNFCFSLILNSDSIK